MWNDLMSFVHGCHARMLTFELKGEEGQGLVEYSLIIALVSVALVGALTALATGPKGIESVFKAIEEKL